MKGYHSLAPGLPPAGRNAACDWPTAANAALASILRSLFPTAPAEKLAALTRLESRLASAGLPPGIAARSLDRGREAAAAVFEWSKDDGGHEGHLRNFPRYQPPAGPGLWVPTPPDFLSALQPFWGRNRCLAIAAGSELGPGDHPPYSEDPGSAFFAEALETYEAARSLTPEQEAITRFWSDDPGQTATPPGHSVAIATQVLRGTGAGLATAAETYVRVVMAVCDAFVSCWYQKYLCSLLRPVAYINRLIEPTWRPLLVTPPFPEYPSGHSVQSAAAFQVLTALFDGRFAFVDHTHDARGRSFGSFLEAGEEAAISRLYGGIHFRSAIVNGLDHWRRIGQAAGELPLRA